MKTLRATLVSLLLLAMLAVPALADGGSSAEPFADVTVSTNCNDDPQSVTITNDSDFDVLLIAIVAAGDFDMENPMDGMGEDPLEEPQTLAAGESATFEAPEGAEGRNFVAILAALDADADPQAMEGNVTFAFIGCIEVDEDFAMPGMPDTGAGAAAGAGLPLGNLAMLLPLAGAAVYAVRGRR